jgi:hypothetical protein
MEFQKLCVKALINHRTTLEHHLKVKGLTKWIVQTMKYKCPSIYILINFNSFLI